MAIAHIVIPARYPSTRLPGKPLAMIGDKPMIQHVYDRARESEVGEVIVATDDARILNVVRSFGGQAFLTQTEHETGTDRINEIASVERWNDEEIVVNVQGDEPFIPPAVIAQVANNLVENSDAGIATVCAPFNNQAELEDENAVKVVRDDRGFALYFSRSVIPGHRGEAHGALGLYRRHIGIYAYRVHALREMAESSKHPLEAVESLEQLRYLGMGGRIHCADASAKLPAGVDTPEDLEKARRFVVEG